MAPADVSLHGRRAIGDDFSMPAKRLRAAKARITSLTPATMKKCHVALHGELVPQEGDDTLNMNGVLDIKDGFGAGDSGQIVGTLQLEID